MARALVRPVFSFAKMRFTPLKSLGNLILMTLICLVIFWIFMALRPAKAATVLWPEVPPTVLFTEPGGILVDHVKRWIDLAASGRVGMMESTEAVRVAASIVSSNHERSVPKGRWRKKVGGE